MVSRGMVLDYKLLNSSKVISVYDSDCFAKSLSFLACVLTEIPSLTPEQVQTGSSYLAEKTFQSLQEMFTSAKEIQDWFTESAKLISTVAGENVEWITPIGLPVVQSYNKIPYDEGRYIYN